MISNDLRPAPLPSRRWTATQWTFLFAAIALLGAAFFVLNVERTAVLVVGAVVAAVCVRRFETSFAFLLGMSMSISYTILLDLRPNLEGISIPLNPLDFANGLILLSIVLNLIGRRESLALPRHLLVPFNLFTLITIVGLAFGLLANSGSMNTYLRDARLFLFLVILSLGVAWFIRSPAQLRLFAYTLIAAAVICAGQQIARFISMGTLGLGGIRDVSLPAPIYSTAITFLLIYRYHGIRLYPRNTYPFVVGFILLALLVSFTRSVWAMMILSYALGLRYMGARQRAKSIFIATGVFVFFVFVVPFAIDLASHGMNLQSLMEARFEQIMGNNDLAREARIVTTVDAWLQYVQSPIWGHGLGYPIYVYDVEGQTTVEDQLLHNSILFYGIKIGAIGALIVFWLFVAPLRRATQVGSSSSPSDTPEEKEVKAFAQALFASFVPVFLIGIWSGFLNNYTFIAAMALVIGLHWDRILQTVRPLAPPERSGYNEGDSESNQETVLTPR